MAEPMFSKPDSTSETTLSTADGILDIISLGEGTEFGEEIVPSLDSSTLPLLQPVSNAPINKVAAKTVTIFFKITFSFRG